MRKSFGNKTRLITTIRLDVKYLAVLDCFLSLGKVHNLINISVFEQFQLLKARFKPLFLELAGSLATSLEVLGKK